LAGSIDERRFRAGRARWLGLLRLLRLRELAACGLRSELKIVSALPVAELRSQADDVARQLREIDARIQKSNWEFDLLQ
jgi:hypothetical protein